MLVSKTPAVKFAVAYVFVDPSKSATLACVYRHQEFHFPVCTGLPEDWIGVKTETEFPVDTGTTITVSCQEGYINTGSSVVTCNTYLYQDLKYNERPYCTTLYGKVLLGPELVFYLLVCV